jgi:hypothetical protein
VSTLTTLRGAATPSSTVNFSMAVYGLEKWVSARLLAGYAAPVKAPAPRSIRTRRRL